jgi:hypothetical protein
MIKVCIQVAAGSSDVHIYNEKTLDFKGTVRISKPYPYPYGFILGTTAEDGDNLDCYLITGEDMVPGAIVECEPIGLLEQHEGEEVDHKILAALPGLDVTLSPGLLQKLQDFIYAVFTDFPETRVRVGPLLPRAAALRHIQAHRSDNRILLYWNEDQDMVNMFSFFLGEHGFLMENVESFDACLESCMSRPPILLIINRSLSWPNDGLEHIRSIRSHPAISYFPIIMGQADLGLPGKERGYREGFEAGANACFGQVFDVTDVLALIKRLIDSPTATGLWDR